MNLEKKDSDSGLLLINAKGNLWASTKGSFCWTTLLNFSRWIRDGGGHGYVKRDGCSLRGEIGVSSIHSLFEEDEVGISLFPVKEIVHSFSPILGLALVSLVLMHLGMVDEMIDSLCKSWFDNFCSFWGNSSLGHNLFLLKSSLHKSFIIVIIFTNTLVVLSSFLLDAQGWTH